MTIAKCASLVLLLTAFSITATSSRAVEVDPQNYGNLTLYYTAAGNPIVRQDPVGGGEPIFHPGNPYGTDVLMFGVNNAPQPAGVTTHTITFDLYSQNYFSLNPDAHIAVFLKSRWYNDNPATKVNELENQGRGIAIGNVSGAPNGCQNHPAAEIESSWFTANALFPESCSLTLQDNYWYKVIIHANNNRWVGYSITDMSGNVFYANSSIQDPTSNMSEAFGGWMITAAMNNTTTPTWKIWLRNVRTTWF